jgi:hypothetical protein
MEVYDPTDPGYVPDDERCPGTGQGHVWGILEDYRYGTWPGCEECGAEPPKEEW